jgi:PKD repeat protein
MTRIPLGLITGLLVLSTVAVAAPTFTERSFGGQALNPGDQQIVVQVITIRGDAARESTIEVVHIRNPGTATSSHLVRLGIALEPGLPASPTASPGTPITWVPLAGKDLQVGIIIPTAYTIPKGATRHLWVMVDVAGVAQIEGGETVALETNLYWYTATEFGNSGFLRDGKPETIQKAGFEEITDQSPDPNFLNPGDAAPVQKFRVRDIDANNQGVKITQVTVKKGAGATARDSDLQTVAVAIAHGTMIYTASKAPTGWDGAGVVFSPADFDPDLPDTPFPDGAELIVTVTITVKTPPTATDPRDDVTIQGEVILKVEENPGNVIDQPVASPTMWPIRRAGFEEVEEQSALPPGLGINPGERLTQKVWVADRDYNGKRAQITALWVRNLGTAETADVAGFTVWVGTTQVRIGWPSGFDLRTGGWIPLTATEVADDREATITIEYRVSPLATTGRTLRPEIRVGAEEPPVASPPSPPTYPTPAVEYPKTITIYPAGFEVVENIAIDPRTVYSTERFVAQKLRLADSDGNTAAVTITRLRVKNIGTAADAQFVKLEVRTAGEAGALLGETTTLTGFRTAGITITPTANNVVADDGAVELWIWLTLAGPEHTVAGRTVRLETIVSFTEGTLSGEAAAVRGSTFEIAINHRPVVQDFTWTPANPTWEQEITFTPGTITDPDGDAIVYSRWDFGEGAATRIVERNGPPEVVRNRYPDGGAFDVVLLVRDARGLEGSKTKRITVTLRPNQAPVVQDIAWEPEEPVVGQAVAFRATVTDADTPPDTPFTYAWDFGDGTTSTLPTPSKTYAFAGTYTVTLIVTDARGGRSSPRAEEIRVLAAPPNRRPSVGPVTATPSAPEAGQEVMFTATATDPEGDPITAWEWDFNGDGTVDSTAAPPVRHTYAQSGVYTVRVRVSDAGGFGDPRTLTLYVRPKGGAVIGTKLLDNPASTQARIEIFLPPGATNVRIQIFDMLGRPVVERDVAGGMFTWDLKDAAGRRIADGIYFYLITATVGGKTERSEVGKILVLR